jgi:hypothetical protein
MNVNPQHSNPAHHTLIFLPQKTSFSFYRYLILQLQVQFNYEISQHTSEISWHTGWESLGWILLQHISKEYP